jgi:carboxyl-terminal processing protease
VRLLPAFSFLILASLAYLWASDVPSQGNTFASWKNHPSDPFTDGEKSFKKVKEDLLTKYADSHLTEDDLYHFAVQGMLSGLNPETNREWNKLYSPGEYHEMTTDLSGSIVGIGIEMKFDSESGIADVLRVIPGTPAAKEGVAKRDKILEINGKSYQGLNLRDVVYSIRGKVGDSVTLTILRKNKVLTKKVRREKVEWDTDGLTVLRDDIGLIAIHQFSLATPKLLKDALLQFTKLKLRGLVVDLRGNGGGLLDKAIDCIQYFLPEGAPIMTKISREGKKERVLSQGNPMIRGIPLAILVDSATACGAEIMASTLRENLSATIIGVHTFGKGSVQSVEELPNHYAYKFTIAGFETGSGKPIDGVGIEPDLVVERAQETSLDGLRHTSNLEERISEDNQLRSALALLQLKMVK